MEDDAIGGWIVLNRRYKPLGGDCNAQIKLEDAPPSSRVKEITVEQHDLLSYKDVESHGVIYLYNDGCRPEDDWDAYAKKLEVLRDLPTM
jgi:hypothetical protein